MALHLYQQVGFIGGEAGCLWSLGEIALHGRDFDEAHRQFDAALGLYCQSGNAKGQADSILGLGWVARDRRQDTDARDLYESSLKLARQVGFMRGQADCLQGLGDLDFQVGNLNAAHKYYEEALLLYAQVPEYASLGHTNHRLMQCSTDPHVRRARMQAARVAWERIERFDLIDDMVAEFHRVPKREPT